MKASFFSCSSCVNHFAFSPFKLGFIFNVLFGLISIGMILGFDIVGINFANNSSGGSS